MAKSKVQFVDYGDEFENNEKEWTIEFEGEEVGRLYKHTGWSGSSWTATHYSVEIEFYPVDDVGLLAIEDERDFDVKGTWAGLGGYGGVFSNRRGYENARKALSAAKKWARSLLEG